MLIDLPMPAIPPQCQNICSRRKQRISIATMNPKFWNRSWPVFFFAFPRTFGRVFVSGCFDGKWTGWLAGCNFEVLLSRSVSATLEAVSGGKLSVEKQGKESPV
ncbi:hypothetical protein MN608_04827 [Microdochium nivale]|nr:hypothetical protein MN608_04827 [Microdochium nivale]